MTLTTTTVEDHLDAVRPLVAADGAELELVGVDGGAVMLRLVMADAHCRECVMPGQLLSQLLLAALQERLPAITAVTVIDPRDATPGPS